MGNRVRGNILYRPSIRRRLDAERRMFLPFMLIVCISFFIGALTLPFDDDSPLMFLPLMIFPLAALLIFFLDWTLQPFMIYENGFTLVRRPISIISKRQGELIPFDRLRSGRIEFESGLPHFWTLELEYESRSGKITRARPISPTVNYDQAEDGYRIMKVLLSQAPDKFDESVRVFFSADPFTKFLETAVASTDNRRRQVDAGLVGPILGGTALFFGALLTVDSSPGQVLDISEVLMIFVLIGCGIGFFLAAFSIVQLSIISRIGSESTIENRSLHYRPTRLERFLVKSENPFPIAFLKSASLLATANYDSPGIIFRTADGDEIGFSTERTKAVMEDFMKSEDELTMTNPAWSHGLGRSMLRLRPGSCILVMLLTSFLGFLFWAALWYLI